MDRELCQLVEGSCAELPELSEVAARIRERYPDGANAEAELLCAAFSYHRKWLEPDAPSAFGPAWEFKEIGSYPKPLDTISEDDLAVLEEYALCISAPLGTGRLHHLLWERRHGRPHDHAKEAIDAYLSLCRVAPEQLERIADLAYSFDLSLSIGDLGRLHEGVEVGRTLALGSLQYSEQRPGMALGVLGVLANLSEEVRPNELRDWLVVAEQGFADPHLKEEALQLQLAITRDAQLRGALAKQIVNLWVDAAQQEERPLIVAAHLQHAMEQATTFGLTAQANEIRELLGAVPIMEDMQVVSGSVSISREEYQAWLNVFLDRPTWQECLSVFGTYEPVGSRRARTIETVKQIMSDFPLQFLMQKTIVDELGAPIAVIRTDDEHFGAALAQQEMLGVLVWAHSAGDILEHVLADESCDASNLRNFFTSPLIPDSSAESFAKGMGYFRTGDFEAALMVSLPAIEASLRVWGRKLGIPVLESGPFGVSRWRGSGGLIRDLEPHVPGGFMAYLRVLLVEPLALNLRNRAMHGLMQGVSKQDAALALHVACALTLWFVGPLQEASKASDQ